MPAECAREVVAALGKEGVESQWEPIGIFLGLNFKRLNAMEGVSEMVVMWLSRSYDTKHFGNPSWQKLVSAVGSKAGAGDIAAAEAIGSMHSKRFVEEICSPNRYFYPQLIQISNPQHLVQLILFQVCTVPDIILCVCVV